MNLDTALLRCIAGNAAHLVQTINSPGESQSSAPGARQTSHQLCAHFNIDRHRRLTEFAIKFGLSAA
jgi:hypothetical protein